MKSFCLDLSSGRTLLKSSRVIVCTRRLLLFTAWILACCVDVPQFPYLLLSWRTFGLFTVFLVIMNKTAIKICLQIFISTYVFIPPGSLPRRGSAGRHGMDILNFINNSSPTSLFRLYFHKQYFRVLVTLNPWQHLVCVLFVCWFCLEPF